MIYKKLLVVIVIALLLPGAPAVRAAGENGAETVGSIPYLLIAAGDKNSQSEECSLGNAVADAVRLYLNSDIAIVCGGDLAGNLLSGDVTWDTLRGVFAEDRPLATATVTIRQLRELLEAGLSHIVMDDTERIDVQASMYEGFPQISGFTVRYDASALSGGRVFDISIGGTRMRPDDETTTVTLAATSFMLEGGYGLPIVADTIAPSGKTLVEVMARYISDGVGDYRNTGERIRAAGTADVPVSGLLIGGVIVVAILLSWSRRKRMLKRFTNFDR